MTHFDRKHFTWLNRFALEMHLVHYNKNYGSVSNAQKYSDGIIVIGLMFQVN